MAQKERRITEFFAKTSAPAAPSGSGITSSPAAPSGSGIGAFQSTSRDTIRQTNSKGGISKRSNSNKAAKVPITDKVTNSNPNLVNKTGQNSALERPDTKQRNNNSANTGHKRHLATGSSSSGPRPQDKILLFTTFSKIKRTKNNTQSQKANISEGDTNPPPKTNIYQPD